MSGSPKKGSSGNRGSQYRRVCKNKSLITLRDGDNAGGKVAWAKTHAYGVYGGRLVFLPAHLGKRSGIEIWLDCREKRHGTITFTRFKANMGKFPLRGH